MITAGLRSRHVFRVSWRTCALACSGVNCRPPAAVERTHPARVFAAAPVETKIPAPTIIPAAYQAGDHRHQHISFRKHAAVQLIANAGAFGT